MYFHVHCWTVFSNFHTFYLPFYHLCPTLLISSTYPHSLLLVFPLPPAQVLFVILFCLVSSKEVGQWDPSCILRSFLWFVFSRLLLDPQSLFFFVSHCEKLIGSWWQAGHWCLALIGSPAGGAQSHAEEVWPSQHKVRDQMSPDYVPLKTKQSPRFGIISLRHPSWKLALLQDLLTAGLPMLQFMCLSQDFTCMLLIGLCKAIKQYLEDLGHTALCWK